MNLQTIKFEIYPKEQKTYTKKYKASMKELIVNNVVCITTNGFVDMTFMSDMINIVLFADTEELNFSGWCNWKYVCINIDAPKIGV